MIKENGQRLVFGFDTVVRLAFRKGILILGELKPFMGWRYRNAKTDEERQQYLTGVQVKISCKPEERRQILVENLASLLSEEDPNKRIFTYDGIRFDFRKCRNVAVTADTVYQWILNV
jgi:hypothetical protein